MYSIRVRIPKGEQRYGIERIRTTATHHRVNKFFKLKITQTRVCKIIEIMFKTLANIIGWVLVLLCMFTVIEVTEALDLNITVEVKSLDYAIHLK